MAEGATHVDNFANIRKIAFTLAEVLITLGIIGVVAAITLPVLINKYRAFVLENQFKTTYSIISQAVERTKYESGVPSLWEHYAVYDKDNGGYYMTNEFKELFYKNIKTVQKTHKDVLPKYKTYDGSQYYGSSDSSLYSANAKPEKVLANGAMIRITIATGFGERYISFGVDTNGLKGPNRMGYDYFSFRIISADDKITGKKMTKLYTEEELEGKNNQGILGDPCSKKSKQVSNGTGCTGFAIMNVCPDDETKKYFECLY